jgi:hypothetical protein
LSGTYPPTVINDVPMCGFSIKRSEPTRPSDVVIFGHGIVKRRLNVDHERILSWIRINQGHLMTIRPRKYKKAKPMLLVVLEELVCHSWAHLSWAKDDNPGITTICLAQSSAQNAPQWQFMGLRDTTLSMSRMSSNTIVSPCTSEKSYKVGAKTMGCRR